MTEAIVGAILTAVLGAIGVVVGAAVRVVKGHESRITVLETQRVADAEQLETIHSKVDQILWHLVGKKEEA